MQRGVLELHQNVTIPAHRTRVFFQDGRSSYGIDEYYPHGELRVRYLSQQTQTVEAAILNLGGLLNGSAPHREDLPGTTMIPKRPAAKFDPADLAV